jgi:hypothetical protein
VFCVNLAGWLESGLIVDVARPLRHQILVTHIKKKYFLKNAVEPRYNDIGLCDISSFASDILW